MKMKRGDREWKEREGWKGRKTWAQRVRTWWPGWAGGKKSRSLSYGSPSPILPGPSLPWSESLLKESSTESSFTMLNNPWSSHPALFFSTAFRTMKVNNYLLACLSAVSTCRIWAPWRQGTIKSVGWLDSELRIQPFTQWELRKYWVVQKFIRIFP